MRLAAIAVLLLLHAAPASARLLLNEILYDPAGDDEGLEFVELWNPDSVAVSLDGILVETGDGSRPGTWISVFVAAPGDSAPPNGAFLIAGGFLGGALQNGPDAIRLRRGTEVLDLLGYGQLTAPELYEGTPAPDVSSGQSLARVQDGVDTGDNAADWAPEPEPTPRRPNHPEIRLSLVRGSAVLDPEVPWPGEPATLAVDVHNRGSLAVDASRWRVDASSGASCPGFTLAPGARAPWRCATTFPEPGRFDLRLVLTGDVPALADTVTLPARVGPGPLLLNEIAFQDRGAGEWVEILVREHVPDLTAYALSDAGERRYAIDPGASPRGARAGALLVLAESPALVRTAYGLPDSLVLGCSGGWPALNDTDGADGTADRVRLWEPDGSLSDAARYRAAAVERDASLERLGAALPSGSLASWSECVDPMAGTPGRANSMMAPSAEGTASRGLLLASARVLRRPPGSAVSPLVLAFGPDARGCRVRVVVHDLLGRARRHLVEGQRVQGEAALVWDGRDDEGRPVAPGAYVARGETIPDRDEPARRASLALTVVDR